MIGDHIKAGRHYELVWEDRSGAIRTGRVLVLDVDAERLHFIHEGKALVTDRSTVWSCKGEKNVTYKMAVD